MGRLPLTFSTRTAVGAYLLTHALAWSHPADTNKDHKITLDEMTAYAGAWTQGEAWSAEPSPITDAHYAQAVLIWRQGEAYREAEGISPPYNWVPDPGSEITYVATDRLSAEPFDLIEIEGIDPGLALSATFTVEGEPGVFETLWQPGTGVNSIEVSVPLNPYTLTGEGTVDLVIRDIDSDAIWQLAPIQLRPLPPAPGAAESMLADLAGGIQATANALGHDIANYDPTNPTGIPGGLRPLVYMKILFDDPENPESFQRLVTDELNPESIDLLDQLVGKLDLGALFDRSGTGKNVLHSDHPTARAPRAEADGGCNGSEFLAIENASELSALMAKQAQAAAESQNSDSARDRGKQLLKLKSNYDFAKKLGNVFKGIDLRSPTLKVNKAISLTLLYWSFFDHFDAGTLPSHFVDLELFIDGPDRGTFLEDATGCETATVIAKASAASDGYDHEQMLADVVPGSPIPGLAGMDTAFEWINETYPDLDILDTDPDVWCGIDVGGDLYSTTTSDDHFEVTEYNEQKVGMDFKPKKVGTGTLTVEISAGQFSGNSFQNETTYSTSPIKVDIINPQLLATGGETRITYRARLSDAAQTGSDDLGWTASAGSVTNPRNLGGGVYEMDWVPSDNNADYPVQITARSKTKECIRAVPAPERSQTIAVQKQGWEIVPRVACLDPGQQEIFSIVDSTENPTEVTWSITAGTGSIGTETGLFTADSTEGSVTIRATPTAEGEQDKFKEHTFNIGCGLLIAWELPPEAAPTGPATVRPLVSGFLLSNQGGVISDVFVSYETITPPGGGEIVGTIDGSFQGAGIFYPGDPDEFVSLIDESNALKTYTSSVNGSPIEYSVTAGFTLSEFEDDERPVHLIGGRDGTQMQLQLDAGGSSTGYPGAEIVAWNWSFSDGSAAGGEVVTPTIDRDIGTFTARLIAVDKLGNSAEYAQTFLIVVVEGPIRFRYSPSGTLAQCYFSAFNLPPTETEGIILEFTTDPEACGSTLFMSGGRTATASNQSSQAGLVTDDNTTHYILGFQPTGGFPGLPTLPITGP